MKTRAANREIAFDPPCHVDEFTTYFLGFFTGLGSVVACERGRGGGPYTVGGARGGSAFCKDGPGDGSFMESGIFGSSASNDGGRGGGP